MLHVSDILEGSFRCWMGMNTGAFRPWGEHAAGFRLIQSLQSLQPRPGKVQAYPAWENTRPGAKQGKKRGNMTAKPRPLHGGTPPN